MSRNRTNKAGPLKSHLPQEEGTIIKDWGGRLPIALVYPNSYYLGMSNLGMHAIYGLLNNYRQVVCERVFQEKEDREKKTPPLSIESQRPLTDFAVIAFSISYELDYFNVIQILKASGIPLHAAERDESHPLIIAGGPCITANPIPLSPFFDCLCIGEAEAILPEMLPILQESIASTRSDLLKELSRLPGLFVPSYYSTAPVIRQWTRNLDSYPVHSVVLTPDTELGDLYLIEAERGCSWGCRFCMVHNTFSPMRFHSADNIINQAQYGLKYRKRIGLVGPAVSNHPQIEEIMSRLLELDAGLSISSLRINPLPATLVSKLAQGKARTVTFAPEAGSLRLRQVIKKNISDEDILSAIGMAAECGIQQLKLYFMIGLPTETDDDIAGIINLALIAKDILDRKQRGARLTLNVAPFVPKAGTPFQWLPMAPLSTLNHRLSQLKNRLPAKGIRLNSESPAWSQVQGVLARGDTGLSDMLADIEELTLSGWRRAIEKHRIDIDFYVHQRWGTSQRLPWAAIDSGAKVEKLEREMKEALD